MRVVLYVVDGPHSGRRTAVPVPGRLQVGRTEDAEFVIAGDERMSSLHFQLECDPQACRLRDLASTNGTFLNGSQSAESMVNTGDTILAGSTTFRVSIEQKDTVAAPAKMPPSVPSIMAHSSARPNIPAEGIRAGESIAQPDQIHGMRLPSTASFPATLVTDNNDGMRDAGSSRRIVGRPVVNDSTGAVLEIVSGLSVGRKIMLRLGQSLTVGRTESADLVVPDPQISAKHFMINNSVRGWQVLDLNSSAGTYLNGHLVTLQRLSSGDRIAAGGTEFIVSVGMSALGANAASTPASECPFREGLGDEDASVRSEALFAAVWTRQPWLIDLLRAATAQPSLHNFDLLYMLAVLGRPSDQATLLTLGACESLAAKRFELLGAFGHPLAISALLTALGSKDVGSAVAAAAAFTKITGLEIESGHRVTLPPQDGTKPDEFEREFLAEAFLPDCEKAQSWWQKHQIEFSRCTRIASGFDVGSMPRVDVLAQLNMQSRYEACLRGKYDGHKSCDRIIVS